jgi:hypothetical protein
MVMDKVTVIMDYVMDETFASDRCYDCDGKNQKLPKFEEQVELSSQCNTRNEDYVEEKEILEEVLEMPSQIGQLKSRTNTEYEVENNQLAITVGDKVTVEDCLGHWSWASPFTVEAVEGEMVKLEMVGELVERERLFRVEQKL